MPFKTEHSARLLDPNTEKLRVRRTRGSGNSSIQGIKVPNNISVIWFIKDEDGKEVPVPQSLRFPIRNWTEAEAKNWLKENKVNHTFEAALPVDIVGIEERVPCYNMYLNETKTALNLLLHGPIGFMDNDSKEFHKKLDAHKSVSTINIDINSPGGSVFDGFSIYNALKAHPAKKKVKISGVAASMASVIAVVGDEVEMPENTTMMIHKPMIPILSMANSDDLRKNAETLDKLEEGIISAYRNRMSVEDKEITNMLKNVTWFTAAEALDVGLADKITEEVDVVDFHDFEPYSYGDIPANVLNQFSVAHGEECNIEIPIIKGDTKNFFETFKNFFKSEIIPLQKRGEEMGDENKIAALETENSNFKTQVSDLNTKLTDATAKLADATTINKNLVETIEKNARESRSSEYKAYCDNLVTEGKIRPVDVDNHVENMELRYQEDVKAFTETAKPTTKLDAYKNMIKEFPKVVDTSGNHVASKITATDQEVGDDFYSKKAKEIVAEYEKNGQKITIKDALVKAYTENPGK